MVGAVVLGRKASRKQGVRVHFQSGRTKDVSCAKRGQVHFLTSDK
jgi:hypothetical protein